MHLVGFVYIIRYDAQYTQCQSILNCLTSEKSPVLTYWLLYHPTYYLHIQCTYWITEVKTTVLLPGDAMYICSLSIMKVELALYHTIKAHDKLTYSILNFCTRWQWVISFMLWQLYPLTRMLGRPQSRSEYSEGWKTSCPYKKPNHDLAVQPVD